MNQNPYKSPITEPAPSGSPVKSTWLDSLKLLIYGLLIGTPIALLVTSEFFRNFVLVTLRYYIEDLWNGR